MSALSIEEAVLAATKFFDTLYEKENFTDILLEEVRSGQVTEQGGQISHESWQITIGYDRHVSTGPAKDAILGTSPVREYKVITINDNTGAVKSMEIREASR